MNAPDGAVFPLHPDVQRVLERTVEALVMLKSGMYLPYGSPPMHADGCSEQEAHDACSEALTDVAALLELNTAKRWSS